MSDLAVTDSIPPRRKPRVKREVTMALARRILAGEIQPGENLPREAELCSEYGVSRTVIREATKVLEAKGLLRSRSRAGTLVLDAGDWNMLDPDLLSWAGPGFHNPRFVESLMEARHIIEPAGAELAAQRATAQDLADLENAYDRMARSLPHDIEACSLADLDFHTALLTASHNQVLVRLAVVIEASMRALFEITNSVGSSHEEALHHHAEIVEAVRLRQPAAARAAISAILSSASVDLKLSRDSGGHASGD
ncbi:transcriptional regulator, GntR family [Faunimonas pinastri]|uniref:Transcriptional regulator, GntR family n=1 Tax=Faunimonas pinastri TaxID=1855383 RepID=A0A1H9NSR7_9HYPH|nr:FadR/GntR family transcriptional regulator [Faunimonas pinastri]SER38669.1 transcriptional regulator, GntR family [Faunimonas pinastri]